MAELGYNLPPGQAPLPPGTRLYRWQDGRPTLAAPKRLIRGRAELSSNPAAPLPSWVTLASYSVSGPRASHQ